jgi:hypothetical protein
VLPQQLDQIEVRHRVSWDGRVERHPRPVGPVPAGGCLDPSRARSRPAADEGHVLTNELATPHEVLQSSVRLPGAGDDEQAGRVAVEPVDDAWALGLLATCDRVREQAVHQCAAGMTGRGMNDDAGGLVDHDQMVVFVCHTERHVFGDKVGLTALRKGELHFFATGQAMALRTRRAVYQHLSLAEQALGGRAGADLAQAGEEAVEPFAGRRRRHGKLELSH